MPDKQSKSRPKKRKAPKTAFKPGQSGNPKGRPPKVRCIPDILRKIGEEEGTRSGEFDKLEVVLRKVYEYALSGKSWAVQFIAERTEGKAVERIEQETTMAVSFEGRDDERDEQGQDDQPAE